MNELHLHCASMPTDGELAPHLPGHVGPDRFEEQHAQPVVETR